MIIMATATPDMPVASTGVMWLPIGATNALLMIYKLRVLVFIRNVYCSSLHSIRKIKSLTNRADKMSSIVDYTDLLVLFLVMVQVLFCLSLIMKV
jgi:3-oxoacyl-[acyl-carrier-protein] synthase-3